MDPIKILLTDFRQIYESSDDYDVIINVGKGGNSEIFKAHSVILKARCPYFQKNKGSTKYNLEDISPEVFKFILKYIYTGDCTFEENAKRTNLSQLLIAADNLELAYLVDYLQDYIIASENNWTEDIIIGMYKESVRRKSLAKIQDFYGKLIAFKPAALFKSSYFTSLSDDIIARFLERDDINIDEVEIWNNVIKWGIAQIPQLNSNTLDWTNSDFVELRRRCNNLVSKIKFLGITNSEYILYIRPYKKILPAYIVDQLEEITRTRRPSYSLSVRKPKSYTINSNIISIEHIKVISDWIAQKNYNNISMLPLFSFELLHRGIDDGFYVDEFHKNCDERGPTLVIIKVKDSNDIIGGYNPLSWSSSGYWRVTDQSFVFSFKNGRFNDGILSRVRDQNTAIHDNHNYKVGFGKKDLLWFNGESVCSSYYRKIFESDSFILEDYEVFQVVRGQKPLVCSQRRPNDRTLFSFDL